MAPPAPTDDQSTAELRALVLELLEKVAEQNRLIVGLREEIARLKVPKGRPDIKPNRPSGMEQAKSG